MVFPTRNMASVVKSDNPICRLSIVIVGGWMRRTVSCVETTSNTAVEEHHCNSEPRPALKHYCMQPPCSASYVLIISNQNQNIDAGSLRGHPLGGRIKCWQPSVCLSVRPSFPCHNSGLTTTQEAFKYQLFCSTISPLFYYSGWPQIVTASWATFLFTLLTSLDVDFQQKSLSLLQAVDPSGKWSAKNKTKVCSLKKAYIFQIQILYRDHWCSLVQLLWSKWSSCSPQNAKGHLCNSRRSDEIFRGKGS